MLLETQRRLLALVSELPDVQAEAIYLRFWEELAPRDIAAALEVPVGTVKTRLKRGLTELRRRMDADTPGGRERWLGALGPALARPEPAGGAAAWAALLSLKTLAGAAIAVMALALVLLARWSPRSGPPSGAPVPLPYELRDARDGDTVAGEALEIGSGERTALDGAIDTEVNDGVVQPRVVEGTVWNVTGEDANGAVRPAAGVEITLTDGWMDSSPQSAVTAADGTFRIELDDASRSVSVMADGDDRFRFASAGARFVEDQQIARIDLKRYLYSSLVGYVVTTERDVDGDLSPFAAAPIIARKTGRRLGGSALASEPRETVADENGRFTFPRLPDGYEFSVDSPDWITTVLNRRRGPSKKGVWPEIGLLAVPVATLRVRVVSHGGDPIEGASVVVSRALARRGFSGDREYRPGAARTDSAGWATIPRVWSCEGLTVTVQDGKRSVTVRHSASVPEDADEKAPEEGRLVLAPGETREQLVRMPELRRVRGRILDARGEPVPNMGVWLRSLQLDRDAGGFVSEAARANEDGTFEVAYQAVEGAMGDGLLVATTVESIRRSMMDLDDSRLAHRAVSLRSNIDGVELRIAPTMTIEGVVTDPAGSPLEASVRARSRDELALDSSLPSGLPGRTRANRDGQFSIKGVTAGSYDLEVDLAGFETLTIDSVPAGAKDLRITLQKGELTLVEVEVVPPPGRTLKRFGLLEMRFDEAEVRGGTVGRIGSELDIRGQRALPAFQGTVGSAFLGPNGALLRPKRSRDRSVEGTSAELRGVPGLAMIAVRFAVDGEGRYLAPSSTGMVRLTEGRTKLRFHLKPSGSVIGRLLMTEQTGALDGRTSRYFANVRTSEGTWVYGPEQRVAVSELGVFRMDRLQVGPVEVLAGTDEEWARDAPSFRAEAHVEENRAVTVRLRR